MGLADYFASHDYLVFAYDATGNGESEGKTAKGMPQGLIDLDYAIRYIKENMELADLPLVLFGHSWGAYSSAGVLNLHPDIKAVVMAAGFNRTKICSKKPAKICLVSRSSSSCLLSASMNVLNLENTPDTTLLMA